MSQATTLDLPQPLGLRDTRFYLATAAMVLGNVALPYAVHRMPGAGSVLMPIFFFTLLAGWRFGAKAGILTGILSPLVNHWLTGMPPAPALWSLIWQSALLGGLAAFAASRDRRPTLRVLGLVVLVHQVLVLCPRFIEGGMAGVLTTARLHLPGALLQVVGGFVVLQSMFFHLTRRQETQR